MFGFGKASRPKAVAFDVIGTVFPLDPLRPRLIALGLPPGGLETWFAAGLRDAFALAAAGDFEPFATVLEAALEGVLAEQGLSARASERKAVVEAMQTLPARADAAEAFHALHAGGCGVLALSNGAARSTEAMLRHAGLDGLVDHIVSVDEVKLSKPRAEVYAHAARRAGVEPGELALVAAHPWDVNGAKAAGLTAAYLASDRPFSPAMRQPDVEASNLLACVDALLAL